MYVYNACSDGPKAVFGSGRPNTEIETAFAKIFLKHGQMLLFYKTITLWFPCLVSLIQKLGKVRRVKTSAKDKCAFLNSRNFPACLEQAIQTRKP